jgi:hypothetical protein
LGYAKSTARTHQTVENEGFVVIGFFTSGYGGKNAHPFY